MLQSPPQTFYV